MKKSKVDRLRSAGWKVGGAKELLELSDEELALIELELGRSGKPGKSPG